MAARRTIRTGSLLCLVFVICAWSSCVHATTTIVAGTQDVFYVQCTGLSNQTPVRNYGDVPMSAGGLNHLSFSDDPAVTEISCHFTYTIQRTPAWKTFSVFPTSATKANCAPDSCQWTVEQDGFYYQDIATGLPTLLFDWNLPANE